MEKETTVDRPNMIQINVGRLKHLEMIQQVITRMANNSFLIRGWSITILSVILVMAVKDGTYAMGYVAVIPVAVFWLLDAFFLRQEKLFRKLYDRYREQPQNMPTDFSMDTTVVDKAVSCWCKVMFSKTLFIFHVGLLVLLGIVLLFSHPNIRDNLLKSFFGGA